jgi:hypothetical protein
VPDQLVARIGGDLALDAFDVVAAKFGDVAGHHAHHVIVVIAAVELVARRTVVERMFLDQSHRLELGEHTVHGGDPHVLAGVDQQPVHIVRGHVLAVRLLEELQDSHPRVRDLEADIAYLLVFAGHRVRPF